MTDILPIDDMWDPSTWGPDLHEHRIYADDRLNVYAVVDAEDYSWAVRWRWNLLRAHGGGRCEKIYLRRSVDVWENGVRIAVETKLLHVEIMKRKGDVPLSVLHTVVNHIDDNSLNCRRENIAWATHRENSKRALAIMHRRNRIRRDNGHG